MPSFRPPRDRFPHHFSVEFFGKHSSPHQNWYRGEGLASPNFGEGIRNAPRKNERKGLDDKKLKLPTRRPRPSWH